VFFHCAKALKRARLWDPDTAIERKEFPTLAQITRDQREHDTPLEEIEEDIQSLETEIVGLLGEIGRS